MVNGLSLSVELATEHLSGDRHLKYVTSELAMGMSVINISCAFENLIEQKTRLSSVNVKRNARIFNTPPH